MTVLYQIPQYALVALGELFTSIAGKYWCYVMSEPYAMLSGQDVGFWPSDFPCPVPDLWLTGRHLVGKLSAVGQSTRQTQPSTPLGLVLKWIVIPVFTWITELGTISVID